MALGRIALVSIKGIVREIEKEIAGVMSISLTNAIQNGLLELRAYGGTEQRNLPEGYTQVEYIEGDGASRIDLNTAINQDDEISIKFSYTGSITGQNVFGGRTNASSQNITAFFAGTANRFVLDFNNSDYSTYRAIGDVAAGTVYDIVMNKAKRQIKNGDTVVFENATACVDTISLTTAYLFFASGSPAYLTKFTGRIYSCKIAGKINLIPCKDSNNEVGMYDTINGVFYTNQGTGTFTAGPNATPTPEKPMDIVSNNGVIKYGQYSNNIFNKNDTANIGNWYPSPSLKIAAAAANNTLVMRAKPGATYYFKHCSVTGGGRAFYTEEENWDIGSDCSAASGITTIDKDQVKSITVSANAKWVFFIYGRSGQTATFEEQLADYMVSLTELTSATPYEPYRFGLHVDGTTETIESTLSTATAEMLLKIGDYVDVQEILSGNITRKVGIKVLTGDNTKDGAWGTSGGASNLYSLSIANSSTDNTFYPISTHFEGVLGSVGYASIQNGQFKHGSNSYVYFFKDTNSADVTAFKAYLATQYENGTPVILVYPLATPTTETVTGQTMNIQAGNNTIEITQASLNTLELSAKYKALP